MVRKGRDQVFANLIKSGERRAARERAATVTQNLPTGQDGFDPSAQHFMRNQGAPPRPDLLEPLLSAQRQGQEASRDQGMLPRPGALDSLLAAQLVYPRDQAEHVARQIEARIQEPNVEVQQKDEGQAQASVSRPQGVHSNQQALFQLRHRFNVQEATRRHRENQIAQIINLSTPIPTRAQAELMLRHQRIRFKQVSHRTPEELRKRRLVLQNVASLWQMRVAIEAIPAVILPSHEHVPANLQGLVDPTDLRTWDGRILGGLYALAQLAPGRPESVTTLLQQSVRRRRDQGLGHDCLTLWDVEQLLRDIRSRQRDGVGGTGDGKGRQDSPSQSTPSSSNDEGDDSNQGGAGATRDNQQDHLNNNPTPANGHAGVVAPTSAYGLKSSSDASFTSDDNNEADKNGTQNTDINHSLSANAPSSRQRSRSQISVRFPPPDPVAETHVCSQGKQQDWLHIQYMQRLRVNQSSPYNSDVSSNSAPTSSGFQINPGGPPVRNADWDNNEMHIETDDEVENGEEESSRSHTLPSPSVASIRSSHSDLYRDPSPETVAAARAIRRLENSNANANDGQTGRSGQNVEDDGEATLVNAGDTSLDGTTLIDDGEIDGPRSTSVAPSTPSNTEHPRSAGLYSRFIDRISRMSGLRARQHAIIPPPRNVEIIPTSRDSVENDVDTTVEAAKKGGSRRTFFGAPSAPSVNRACTHSQTFITSHQSSRLNSEGADREAAEEHRLTDAHEAARHAFDARNTREGRVPLIDQMMDGYLCATSSQDERRRDQILRNFAAEQGQAYGGNSAFGDEEADYAALNDEEIIQEEPAPEFEDFPSYTAVATPSQQNDAEARNSSGNRKRRRTRSWGSRTFRPSPSKKRKTESPKSPTPPSRDMTPLQSRRIASPLSSAPRSSVPRKPSSSSSRIREAEVETEVEVDIPLHIGYEQIMKARMAAAAAEGEQSGSEEVEEDQNEGEAEEENEDAQVGDANNANEDDDEDNDHRHVSTNDGENDEGDKNDGEKTPSSSSSASLPSSSSLSSGGGNSNCKPIPGTSLPVKLDTKNVREQVRQPRNDPNVPGTLRYMTHAEYNELGAKFDEEQANLHSEGDNSPSDDGNDDGYDNENLPENIIPLGHLPDFNPPDSSDDENSFSFSSSSSSSYAESDSTGSLPSNVTNSDHESYDFTPSPSQSTQSQDQDAYNEMQADADAFHQFIQEQYGEDIAEFFQNIDRQDGRKQSATGNEANTLSDIYQAQDARSSSIEEHAEFTSESSTSSINSINNAYDNARRTITANARMRELSGRPRTGSGDLDYDGTHPGLGSSQSRSSDRLRSVSGASRVTRSSSASGRSSVHVGNIDMGRRVTKIITLRPGESLLVKVAPKE
jgi:hypothetical protein